MLMRFISSLSAVVFLSLVASPLAEAQTAPSPGIWGAMNDLPQHQVQAIARKLYALGFGGSERADWKSDVPDWVTLGDKSAIGVAVAAWRKTNGATGGNAPITNAEIDRIGDAVASNQWAAIGYEGAGAAESKFTSARTWNRPTRQLAERIVIDRCAQQDAAANRNTACRSNMLVFSGNMCAVLMLRFDGSRSTNRPKDNNELLAEPIVPVLKTTPDEANTAVRIVCNSLLSDDGVRCLVRHLVCADGRESF